MNAGGPASPAVAPMRLCFFTKYSRLGASSRYRTYQYVPHLEARGHRVTTHALLPDAYLEALYRGRRPARRLVALAFARRAWQVLTAGAHDVCVVEKELLPWVPPWLERLLFARNRVVVGDYDDAIHTQYADSPRLRGKIAWFMSRCRTVIAANREIEAFARQSNPRTEIVPTVIDFDRYAAVSQTEREENSEITAVWIGTPVTAKIVEGMAPLWRELCERFPRLGFRFVGAAEDFRMDGVRQRNVPWNEACEVEQLASAQIGIMPLEDTPFQRGKSALKIIQYMACGLPVVASPVGANRDVVREGSTGFLAPDRETWLTAFERLTTDPALRTRMGQEGRRIARAEYSLEATVGKLESILDRARG